MTRRHTQGWPLSNRSEAPLSNCVLEVIDDSWLQPVPHAAAAEQRRRSEAARRAGSGGGGGWDQFAANEALTGSRGGFDESVYTTAVDKS